MRRSGFTLIELLVVIAIIAYISPARHTGGANYVFSDGHAKYAKLEQTLNTQNFLWGKKAYAAGGMAVYDPATGMPVQ